MPEQTEGATVKANFGPDFAYPQLGSEAKPMSAVPAVLEAELASQAAAATAVAGGSNQPQPAATTAA